MWSKVKIGLMMLLMVCGGVAMLAYIIIQYGDKREFEGRTHAIEQMRESQEKHAKEWQKKVNAEKEKGRIADEARKKAEGRLAIHSGRIADLERSLNGLSSGVTNPAGDAGSGSGFDEAGTGWRGLFNQCVQEVGSLSRDYDGMAKESGRLADKVTGLQGYVMAIAGD